MEKVIEVKNLNFGYDENLILKDINFVIEKGDYVGIIGENGSGKSTLIKLLLNINSPLSGEINILGENIKSFNRWSKIGYVSQKANSFNKSFPATVEEIVEANLFSSIGMFKFPNKYHKRQVYEALDVVGLKDYGKRLIGNLSGGQQQRVFIARTLVNKPSIMVLDEPTVGIDAKSEEAVYCLLARLNKELGITIVMITHDIGAVTVHANKIFCISGGSLLSHDPSLKLSSKDVSNLYGYGVNLHVHDWL